MHHSIKPDIFTLAKGLGGGVPIGAVLASPTVADAFEPGDHGTTFGGNPLACAAGNYVIDKLTSGDFSTIVTDKGNYFKSKLKQLQEKHTCIKEVRGKGLLIGMELYDSEINGKELTRKALDNGFIINCAGHNTIRLAPPLIISIDEINLLINFFDKILP